MGRSKNLSGLEPEEADFVKEKMSGYQPEATNYKLRNKGLDFKINLKFKNEKQKELNESIKNNQVTFCSGKAGTGKSFVAFASALSILKDNDNFYKKIILIVPTVQSDIELGFLKGSLDDKIGPHAEAHLYTMEKSQILK
jgi:phosphate starvation-inducible protein PhoH